MVVAACGDTPAQMEVTRAERREQAPAAAPNFDRVALVYRWAEYLALGPLLKRTREQFLAEVTTARKALVLGDGDGRFTAALLRAAPGIRVRAVDSSAAMLRLLRARCLRDGTAARLTTEHALVQAVSAEPGCDLLVTHFLLDCLSQSEVSDLAARLATQVSPHGRWVVSEFGLPRNRLLRPAAAAYIRLLYLAFHVLTGLQPTVLPDPQHALSAAGFVRLRRVERLAGLLYAELWQLAPRPGEPGQPGATSGDPPTSTQG